MPPGTENNKASHREESLRPGCAADHKYTVAMLFDPDNDWIFREVHENTLFARLSSKFTFSQHFDHRTIRNCDIVFVLGYTRILESEFLAANKLTLIVHESDLPQGRGFSPVQWQVLEGCDRIPVCLLKATAEVDAGEIFEKAEIRLEGHELFDEIRRLQAETTLELMERFLLRFPQTSPQPQTGEATVYRRRTRKDDRIDAQRSIASQFNALRVADNQNYPAYFVLNGHTYYLKIYRSPHGEANHHR